MYTRGMLSSNMINSEQYFPYIKMLVCEWKYKIIKYTLMSSSLALLIVFCLIIWIPSTEQIKLDNQYLCVQLRQAHSLITRQKMESDDANKSYYVGLALRNQRHVNL